MRNLAIVIVLATLLMGCNCNANTSQTASVNQGNLRFEKNRLIVSAMLADSTSIELELDSGCANGYANIDSVTLERISKLQTQPNTSNQITLQVDGNNLSYKYFINQHTRPLIGLNCKDTLRRWAVCLSQNRLDIIPDDSLVNMDRYCAIPIRVKYGLLPIAELPITFYKDGRAYSFKRSFLVDTGTPMAFCIMDPDSELMAFVNSIPHCQYDDALTEIFNRQGRAREHIKFILDSVAVQSFVVERASCDIDVGVRSTRKEFGDDVIGTIGMGILKNFDLIFDYRGSQLLIAPHGIEMPYYEQAEGGLGFTYSKSLRVSFVQRGHNAHKSGLRPGDEIVTINNIPHDRLLESNVMDSLRMLPENTPIHLKIRRGDKVLDINYLTFSALR
ncbi:MAG: PDZ domain-containing protein [Alistipes sp.]|nr:PDZ domain-containing protein [Alistipes sp.]